MNKWWCRLVVSFLLMIALADLLLGDSALLLYFNESGTRIWNYLFMSVSVSKLKVFLSIVAMIVRMKQDDNCL